MRESDSVPCPVDGDEGTQPCPWPGSSCVCPSVSPLLGSGPGYPPSEKPCWLLSDTVSSFCCLLSMAKMSPKPTCLAGQDLTGAPGHFPQTHVRCPPQLVTDGCQAQENGFQRELTPQKLTPKLRPSSREGEKSTGA